MVCGLAEQCADQIFFTDSNYCQDNLEKALSFKSAHLLKLFSERGADITV